MNGYLLYSPEKNDIYVSNHVVFHRNHAYDVSYTDQHAFDMTTRPDVSTYRIEPYRYLEGTNRFDSDDGLLYKHLSVV